MKLEVEMTQEQLNLLILSTESICSCSDESTGLSSGYSGRRQILLQ